MAAAISASFQEKKIVAATFFSDRGTHFHEKFCCWLSFVRPAIKFSEDLIEKSVT